MKKILLLLLILSVYTMNAQTKQINIPHSIMSLNRICNSQIVFENFEFEIDILSDSIENKKHETYDSTLLNFFNGFFNISKCYFFSNKNIIMDLSVIDSSNISEEIYWIKDSTTYIGLSSYKRNVEGKTVQLFHSGFYTYNSESKLLYWIDFGESFAQFACLKTVDSNECTLTPLRRNFKSTEADKLKILNDDIEVYIGNHYHEYIYSE